MAQKKTEKKVEKKTRKTRAKKTTRKPKKSVEKKKINGRPTKLTEAFVKAAEEVITDSVVLYCTDEEMLFLINEKLFEWEQRVTKRTFERWKQKVLEADYIYDLPDHLREFCRLIRGALIKQKLNLFNELEKDRSREAWKWTWILERKFKEWNLTHLQKVDSVVENKSDLTINISGHDPEKHGQYKPFG